MPGFYVKRTKLQGLQAVAASLFTDFKAAGLAQVLPATGQNFTPTGGAGKFVLESAPAVNPLHATQPWRLLLDLSGANAGQGTIKMAIAGPQQIDNTGAVSSFPGANDTQGARVMGQLGVAFNKTSSVQPGEHFISRMASNMLFDSGTTTSYIMTSTARGIGLFVWDEGSDSAPKYSWFFVQSPVNKDNGAARIDANSPIFCVFSCDAASPRKFVVNENDVFRPSPSMPADTDDVNSSAILNSKEQVAISIGNKYLITFPNRLNTERYAYTDELDLFAYTSADVIAEDSEIAIRPYGEVKDRVYRAMKASGPNNTGMRLMMLISGGGIDAV